MTHYCLEIYIHMFWVHVAAVCGGNITGTYGDITSPNYPDNYPNGRTCVWIFRLPTNHQILLNVTDFNMRGWGSCQNYDYLEIRY